MNICSSGDIQMRGWVNEESGGSPTKGIAWCQIPMGRVKYDVKSQTRWWWYWLCGWVVMHPGDLKNSQRNINRDKLQNMSYRSGPNDLSG